MLKTMRLGMRGIVKPMCMACRMLIKDNFSYCVRAWNIDVNGKRKRESMESCPDRA